MELPQSGTVRTMLAASLNSAIDNFTTEIAGNGGDVLIITRLAPRRLVRYIDLEEIEFRWLSTQDDEHAIDPSLEHLSHLIFQRVESGSGVIWFDGFEYLAGRQGFHAAHSFVRSLVDLIGSSEWSVLILIAAGTLDSTQIAQINREAPLTSPPQVEHELTEPAEEISEPSGIAAEEELLEENISGAQEFVEGELSHLSRLTRSGFSRKSLRERIIQWRGMGLDVSALEPALHYTEEESAFALYLEIDELVRRAIDIDARLDLLRDVGESAKMHAFQYRIRQLTSLDEIERMVDLLVKTDSVK